MQDRDVSGAPRIRLLGPLEVLDGGVTVRVRSPLQRLLLTMLVLEANRTLPADRLIDELWGDQLPSDPAGALRLRGDPASDPAELADTSGPDEICDPRLGGADQVGGATVRPRRVRVRSGELEQGRERIEPLGDRTVVQVLLLGHGGSVTAR